MLGNPAVGFQVPVLGDPEIRFPKCIGSNAIREGSFREGSDMKAGNVAQRSDRIALDGLTLSHFNKIG
jgi:hypothetical protein